MVYSLNYRRPPHHETTGSSETSLSSKEKQSSIDESVGSPNASTLSNGIPEALSFDRIIGGGTCPPVTLRDFMNYLKYVELDAENLQFYLWARAYIYKFNALPDSEKKLSPEWSEFQAEADTLSAKAQSRNINLSPETSAALRGTGLEPVPKVAEATPDEKSDPFNSPPRTPSQDSRLRPAPSDLDSNPVSSGWHSTNGSTNNSSQFKRKAENAFDDAGLKWQPFTIQPYRDEIARVITIYIADGAPRQLNLSSKERNTLLHALENTTHPTALRSMLTTVEWSLRCQSHPNFIRWAICNGNRPRVVFARGLGVFCIVGGLTVGIFVTLSSVGRAWRVLALILLFIGIATLIAAVKGMCVVLHGMHHRHLRPWELFSDEDDELVELKNESAESLMTATTNSYEDEPWVAQYKKRNIIRKIFDRELWVQEPALRQIQDTIFLQAVIGGLMGGAILTAIFVAVPAGHLY